MVRLATEGDNDAAIRQVEGLGYRRSSTWLFSKWDRASTQPSDSPGLSQAPAQDADAAWVFWSTCELSAAGRGLWSEGWRWRSARPVDLNEAAEAGSLYQASAGWAVVTEVEHDTEYLRADWVATDARDLPTLVNGLLGLAHTMGKGLYVRLPNVDWGLETLTRAGGDPSPILVFAKPVI